MDQKVRNHGCSLRLLLHQEQGRVAPRRDGVVIVVVGRHILDKLRCNTGTKAFEQVIVLPLPCATLCAQVLHFLKAVCRHILLLEEDVS